MRGGESDQRLSDMTVVRSADGSASTRIKNRFPGRGYVDVPGHQKKSIDLQGHRGARGLLPENSIPAFRKALELGVDTLEMDAVISADGQVVVSHEPWMSGTICLDPGGARIGRNAERRHNIYALTFDEIAQYDCGSRGNPRFPGQEALPVSKPLLRQVIEMAETYAVELGRSEPRYNVEIKSSAQNDGIFHPAVDVYARLLYDVLVRYDVLDRTTVQSFDSRALRAMRAIDSDLMLSLLVDNRQGFRRNVQALGFTPEVYSPNFRLVGGSLVRQVHEAGADLIPWTVNTSGEMNRMLRVGVDGIITDYPDLGRRIIDAFLDTSPSD